MTDELHLFEPPGPAAPPGRLSRTRQRTLRDRSLLERGIHPATRTDLLDPEWGFTCGDCINAAKVGSGRRSWWKCLLHRLGASHSADSDIRKSWPACSFLRIDGGGS